MTYTTEPAFAPPRPATPDDGAPEPGRHRLRATIDLLRHRLRIVTWVMFAAAAGGLATALLLPPSYIAQASFFPESKSGNELGSALGGLSSLVGSLGASGGGAALSAFGQPAVFFLDLLKSQSFLDSLAGSRIIVDSLGNIETVERYLVPKAKTPGIRRWNARKSIKRHVHVEMLPAGIVLVSVDAESPYAAAAMANRAVNIVDELNIVFRRRQASARRTFSQEFLADVGARRDSAERRLEDFMLANRTFETSPVLKQRYTTLYDEVNRLRMLRESVEQTVENDRLTEYNNAPVVARVDQAAVPERRSGPHRTLIAVGTVVVAALLLFWWAYWSVADTTRR